jgi:hypothetical protein
MDPNQLATESAAAAFVINCGLVLLAGLAGGGLLALLITALRASAMRHAGEDWPYGD